jgi:hypothetical protein
MDTLDPWDTTTPAEAIPAAQPQTTPAQAHDDRAGEDAVLGLGHAMYTASDAIGAAEGDLPTALAHMAATVQDDMAVEVIAWAQDMRRRLLAIEDVATTYAARNLTTSRSGVLTDGRLFEVHRTSNRKTWQHDAWQHDARQAVVTGAHVSAELADPSTGALVNVYDLLTAVQAFHGATAPKVTALRAAGLDPDDYCETVPGRWSVTVADPTTEGPQAI